MKCIALSLLSLLCLCALITDVDNQNVVGAIRSIFFSLNKFGLLSFVTNPDLIENFNNSQGPTAFLYRQLLTQIPQFVSNTLRDCLQTEVDAMTPKEQLFSQFPLLVRNETGSFVISSRKRARLADTGDGCPGISSLFPADSCLGRPTYASDPGANVAKTNLIFVDQNRTDHVISYDSFVMKPRVREKAITRFFKRDQQILILIHGWTDRYYRDGWIWSVKEFVLDTAKPKPNILIVDWRQWSQSLAITRVKMNVLNVADQLATVLHLLTQEKYYDNSKPFSSFDVTIYGHSYGGPVAGRGAARFSALAPLTKGMAAKQVNNVQSPAEEKMVHQQIYFILALDPSDQCFGRGSSDEIDDNATSTGQEFGSLLDSTSARLVKVIHTDSNAFGAYSRLGTVDIYLNQGSGQPDCPVDVSSATNVDSLYTLACSHYRATRIMTQPYYNQSGGTCEPVAFRCSSFDDFLSGSCTCLFTDRSDSTTLILGSPGQCRQTAANPYEEKPNVIDFFGAYEYPNHFFSKAYDNRDSWYLIMGSEPPYCLGTFLYSLRASEIPNNVISTIQIDDNPIVSIDFSSNKQGILTMAPDKIGRFDHITLSYSDIPGELLGKQRRFRFQAITLFYLSKYDYCYRKNYTRMYCAYTGEFRNITRDAHADVTPIEEKFPGAARTIDVKFTNDRCLDIIDHCSDELEEHGTLERGSPCEAFVIGYLKDYLLAFLDKFCNGDDTKCSQFLACLYYRRSKTFYPGLEKGFYSDILGYIKDQNYTGIAYTLVGNHSLEETHNVVVLEEGEVKNEIKVTVDACTEARKEVATVYDENYAYEQCEIKLLDERQEQNNE
ncbi:Lipase member H [Halotydeus destructor]|nr:Lipase member H [Halotydeus destructor]